MTTEEKELLKKDIFARIPYGVKVQVLDWDEVGCEELEVITEVYEMNRDGYLRMVDIDYEFSLDNVTLLLRPLESMTEDEEKEWDLICSMSGYDMNEYNVFQGSHWLNSHFFDYKGLIERGLTIEAPEGTYKVD